MNRPRIGVVLSSGGARGVYAHTGFLLALARLGIPIAAAAGCSAGAVVGGIAASGADLIAWSDALARVDRRRFWTPDPWPARLWQFVVKKGRGYTGLSGTETAMEFCRRQLAVQTFEECRYPFHALAVSLRQGRKVMFSHGELAPRMVASAATPVLYRPVEIDGDWYCSAHWWISRRWMRSVAGMDWMRCSSTTLPRARRTSDAFCKVTGPC